jgi:hypothetical protein
MAQQTLGFWDRFYSFFVFYDRARWKAIIWTVFLGGTAGSIALTFMDATVDEAAVLMSGIGIISAVVWIFRYL